MDCAVVGEVEVRSPESQYDHEQCCNLEGVGRDLKRLWQNESAISLQGSRTDGHDCNSQQEESQEATDALAPGKPDAVVLEQIGHDYRIDDSSNGGTSSGNSHGHWPSLEKVMTDDGY